MIGFVWNALEMRITATAAGTIHQFDQMQSSHDVDNGHIKVQMQRISAFETKRNYYLIDGDCQLTFW